MAVRTLLDWIQAGEDVDRRMPELSTFLGHIQPESTYWYLQAVPELMALIAARLERLPEVLLLGWVQVQPDDVHELLLKPRIARELEGLHPMRLKTAGHPDPLHRGRRHAGPGGHRPAAPMRLPRRRLMQRCVHDLLDLALGDRRLAPPARPHTGEVPQPILTEPLAPVHHRRRRHTHFAGDLRVREPVRSHQQRTSSLHITIRRGPRADQFLEHRTLLVSDRKRWSR